MEAPSVSNPLVNITQGIPAQTLRAASVAGRIFGAGLLIAVAFDQSYNPTQVFTVGLAIAVLASLVPLSGSWADCLAALGAGLVFFAGTVLTHLAPGLGLLAMGLVAGLAGFAFAQRNHRDAVLPAIIFLAAVGVVGAFQAFIVFNIE